MSLRRTFQTAFSFIHGVVHMLLLSETTGQLTGLSKTFLDMELGFLKMLTCPKFFLLFSALEDFNNGVVLTSRPLRVNELFEVRLDKMVSKWAGSIEIGVTTYSPTELEYPATMTNIR